MQDEQLRRKRREIIESYFFSTAGRDVGIYGERFLRFLVEYAQRYINDLELDFKDETNLRRIDIGPLGEATVVVPLREVMLGDEATNYTVVKNALRSLMSKFVEYEDDEVYRAHQIVNDVDVSKVKGRAVIEVNKSVWVAIMDFSKGYSLIDIETSRRLKSRYSLRILPLISNKKDPVTISIDDLRKQWKLEDRYKLTKDFVRNTIAVAKEELDRVSPWTFTYILNTSKSAPQNAGRTAGRLAATSVTFFPRRQILKQDSFALLRKDMAPSMILTEDERRILKERFGFDNKGLQANLPLLDAFRRHDGDLPGFLRTIGRLADNAINPAGYVVSALRKRLMDLGIEPPGQGR